MILDDKILVADVFMVSLVVAGLAAYPVFRILLQLKARQTVSQYLPEHQGKQGTPTMGGFIILVGACAGIGFALVRDITQGIQLVGSILLLIGFGAIGFIDDFVVPRVMVGKRGLGWKQKIILEVVVASLVSLYVFEWTVGWACAAQVFLILFFSNAFNFSDGLDGLAGSLLLAFGAGLLALLMQAPYSDPGAIAVLAACLAAAIPFLVLNAPPAKVFMGDVGSLPVGAVLGLITAGFLFGPDSLGLPLAWRAMPVVLLSLVFLVELVPVPLQILSVKLRRKKLFPMTPIHHAFEARGVPESKIVWFFALSQAILSAGSVYLYLRLIGVALA